MSNEINLLYNKKQGGSVAIKARILMLRYIALGLLFIIGVISVIVFILILASPLPELKKQESALLTSLSTSHSKIVKQVLITSRLQDISKIVAARPDVDDQIVDLRKKIPLGVEIKSLRVDTKQMMVTISAASLLGVESFTQELTKMGNSDKTVRGVSIDSVEFTSGELYEVAYTITYL